MVWVPSIDIAAPLASTPGPLADEPSLPLIPRRLTRAYSQENQQRAQQNRVATPGARAAARPVRLEPPHNGTILRIVEFLPRAVCARETCLRGVTPAES